MTSKYWAALVLLGALAISVVARPRYIECVNSDECSVTTCCMLGMGKFSIPRCMEYGERGQVCRPDNQRNVTLFYPDGQNVDVTNVYLLTCPCAPGLYCSAHTNTCEDPFEESKHNYLDDNFVF